MKKTISLIPIVLLLLMWQADTFATVLRRCSLSG